LSRRSSLSEPPRLTYALSLAGWKLAMKSGREAFPEPLPNTDEWEIWTYEPALDPESETVDPLSLTLSLRDSSDEDVQRALDELKEWFPW
jgi:hypothetical protein